MKTVYIVFMIIMFTGVAVWREKYGLHDPTVKTNSSVDIRVKYGNRILTLFHIITFLGGALSPMGYSYTEFMDFVVGSLSLLGSQILLQFMLIILSEFYVQYDVQVSNKDKFKGEVRTLIKEKDSYYKESNDSYLEIFKIKHENYKFAKKIKSLEDQLEFRKQHNDRLYDEISRLNQNKIDNEKIKKRIMDSLLNKIDENQHKVQEGDYLIMMNLLKQIYE
jgi:hypothetical protein